MHFRWDPEDEWDLTEAGGGGKARVPGTMGDLPDTGRGGRLAQGWISLKQERGPTRSIMRVEDRG